MCEKRCPFELIFVVFRCIFLILVNNPRCRSNLTNTDQMFVNITQLVSSCVFLSSLLYFRVTYAMLCGSLCVAGFVCRPVVLPPYVAFHACGVCAHVTPRNPQTFSARVSHSIRTLVARTPRALLQFTRNLKSGRRTRAGAPFYFPS